MFTEEFGHAVDLRNDFARGDYVWGTAKGAAYVWGAAGAIYLRVVGGTAALTTAGMSASTAQGVAISGAAVGVAHNMAIAHQNPNAGFHNYAFAAGTGGFSGGLSPFGAYGSALGSGVDYADTGRLGGRFSTIGGMLGDTLGTGGLALARSGGALGYAARAIAPDVIGGGLGFGAGYAYSNGNLDTALQFAQYGTMAGSVASQFLIACFTAGTPIVVDFDGRAKLVEDIREGDLLLARDEHDPDGPLVLKRVEEVFVRVAPVIELVVRGKVIGTTAEHPFYVLERHTFVPAGQIEPGETFVSDDEQLVTLEEIRDNGRVETVYNFRIADFHTYFVGGREWGFSVWVHNANYSFDVRVNNYRDAATGRFVKARNLPWPVDEGFATSRVGTLRKGTIIDRYGSSDGFVAGRPGDSVSRRGLAPGSEARPYAQFQVIQPIKGARIGTAAPVPQFDASGGGRQYTFGGRSIQDLIDAGYLRQL